MKTYLKGDYGVTGSITAHRNGTATLRVRLWNGKLVRNSTHASPTAAKSAWYRMNRDGG